MQIKKISNNKLKVILSVKDLNKKNIDIDSFLSNSIESQDLFFEILDLAEAEFDFNIEDNKAVVEAISLDNNIFILTITKFKNDFLDITTSSKVYRFENIDDFLKLYSLIQKNNIYLDNSKFYLLNNKFYIILNTLNSDLENLLLEYSMFLETNNFLEDILIEHGKKINISI